MVKGENVNLKKRKFWGETSHYGGKLFSPKTFPGFEKQAVLLKASIFWNVLFYFTFLSLLISATSQNLPLVLPVDPVLLNCWSKRERGLDRHWLLLLIISCLLCFYRLHPYISPSLADCSLLQEDQWIMLIPVCLNCSMLYWKIAKIVVIIAQTSWAFKW